jgi:asparagine synthase (glutamine-hydrolysing)
MCGIAGGINIDPRAVERALAKLAHRGPDGSGLWRSTNQRVVLGHRRLSIIDLSAGAAQPMLCARTGNAITFNGEIYNYFDLRTQLIRLGWNFATSSDTEVALAAYGQWGSDCFPRFNGMFALVIYDALSQRVVLARDRVGKKPLYYAVLGESLAFASELKALLECVPTLPREIDREALKAYVDLGYVPSPLAIFSGVRKLQAATVATFDLLGTRESMSQYWRLPAPDPGIRRIENAAEELDLLLQDAVKLRLQADVPVGVFLSGGLDSSLVAAVCAQKAPSLKAFTVKFRDAAYDESGIAARVASWIGLPHTVIETTDTSRAELERLAGQFDEPFADASCIPTFLISRAAREHVTVALSGDGGDELFAGYDAYHVAMTEGRLEYLPAGLRRFLSRLNVVFPVGVPGKNFLRRLAHDRLARFMQLYRAPEAMEASFVGARFAEELAGMRDDGFRETVLAQIRREQPRLSALQEMTRLDFCTYLPDDVLVKVDRASMLASLEIRSPLLDYRIVELALRLPDALTYAKGMRKALLKEVARKYLPPDFPYQRKMGFSPPVSEWFGSSWANLPYERGSQTSGLVDLGAVRTLQQRHNKTRRYGRQLFQALMLAFFEANYVDLHKFSPAQRARWR